MKTLHLRSHYSRIFLVAACAAIVGLVGVIASVRPAYAETTAPSANEHIVTVHDDGVDKGFITQKHTLREALAEANIRVDAKDRTEPSLDEVLNASSYEVNIYRARPVVIHDGTIETKVVTSYRTPKQIASEAKISLQDEDIATLSPSTDPMNDGAAEVMQITRATGFTFDFYGKVQQSYTQAKTVGDMLKQKGIAMQSADGISPAVTTPITAGMSVKLWRNGVQTVTQEEDVNFDTKKIEDADQPVGYRDIQTAGVNGKRTVTYEINMQNGVEVSRKEINSVTTKEPTQQVEVIGVKPEFTGSFAEALAKLRQCEAGGVYDRNSGNGYYGAYQYNISTWGGYQGYARADLAPPSVQDQKVWETYQRRGWQPWPVCGAQRLPDIYR